MRPSKKYKKASWIPQSASLGSSSPHSRVLNSWATSQLSFVARTRSNYSTSTLQEERVSNRRGTHLHVVRRRANISNTTPGLPILCIPGALGTAITDFQPQLEGGIKRKLKGSNETTEFEVISFDPCGYGLSRPPEREFPLDYWVRDGEDGDDVMRALGFDKYNLIGWSDGAIASMFLAAREPKRVARLVLVAGNSFITEEDVALYEKTRDVAASWSPYMRESLEGVYGGVEGLQSLWTRWCNTMQKVLKDRQGDICTQLLKDITCPTLIVQGAKDAMTPPSHAPFLASHIKGAHMHIFPEGKHNVHIKYSKDFNDMVSDFFSEV